MRFFTTIWHWLRGRPKTEPASPTLAPTGSEPLRRVVLMSEVRRTLFDDFARHRATQRGDEEIGWLLLGVRDGDAMVVHATLPAGEYREAGVAHVRFNSQAQAVASRFVRQNAKHLRIVGVVHTHPGRLRHPSSADFTGDREWVRRLRDQEAIFAIGTTDAKADEAPAPHQQVEDGLTFHWYALAAGDKEYRTLPVEVREGLDLAKPLHPHWSALEEHAESLENLCGQLAQVSCEVVPDSLRVRIALPRPGHSLLLVLAEGVAACYVQQQGELFQVELPDAALDRAVFLVLAELARKREHAGVLASR